MRAIGIYFFVLSTLILSTLSPTIIASAQEKEKTKPVTTVDAWREALPPQAEDQKPVEEIAGVAPSVSSNEEAQKALLSLERTWMDSIKTGDADSLSQIISEGFTFANPRAIEVKDRIKYLEYALQDLKVNSYEFDKTTVRFFGRTAIVSGVLKQNATVRGVDWSGNYLVTDVWIGRGGTWRVVSRHESPLQARK